MFRGPRCQQPKKHLLREYPQRLPRCRLPVPLGGTAPAGRGPRQSPFLPPLAGGSAGGTGRLLEERGSLRPDQVQEGSKPLLERPAELGVIRRVLASPLSTGGFLALAVGALRQLSAWRPGRGFEPGAPSEEKGELCGLAAALRARGGEGRAGRTPPWRAPPPQGLPGPYGLPRGTNDPRCGWGGPGRAARYPAGLLR